MNFSAAHSVRRGQFVRRLAATGGAAIGRRNISLGKLTTAEWSCHDRRRHAAGSPAPIGERYDTATRT